MPSSSNQTNRNQEFGRLLSGAINSIALYEGKRAEIVEESLGQVIGVSGKTVQRYKAGYLPPEQRTIEILAEAAITRAFLNREWLQRFLHIARYYNAQQLLDQLCPIGAARPRPPRIHENLPAPTYNQFVMREPGFGEVIDGLQQRSAVVLIIGLGGNGKTSLAREIAARCLQENGDVPSFDAVVWVSDKYRSGTTNLSVVLDEVARTLDYPGFTQFAHDEKQREVEQLLRRQRVLLVVDNFETITDGALLTWLLRLPEPSKAVVTSREYTRSFRNSTVVVELRGMTEKEAWAFIDQRLDNLRIKHLVQAMNQLDPLVVATGGNPKAIEMALGLLKHEHRPLHQVVDALYTARGELFDDLFTRAWSLLDEAVRRVLLVMPLFADSVNGKALATIADVQGYAFDRSVERLTDLALLDVQQESIMSAPRYALHPLVRAFAGARLAEQPEFERNARERWIQWYVGLTLDVGWCWNDLARLRCIDPEQKTVFAVVKWALEEQRNSELHQLTKGIGFYCYARGVWETQSRMELLRYQVANYLADSIDEVEALSFYVQVLCKQGELTHAEEYLTQLEDRMERLSLPGDVFFLAQHARALYFRAKKDLDMAEHAWRASLNCGDLLSDHIHVINRQWLALCLALKGQKQEALDLFHETLARAEELNVQESVLFCTIKLAELYLERNKPDKAMQYLLSSYETADEYQFYSLMPEIHRLYAQVYIVRGDLASARSALTEAIDHFRQLGMRSELAEARDALNRLQEKEAEKYHGL